MSNNTIQDVQNRFKIGGVEYRLVTDGDPDSDPKCLVSVSLLRELFSTLESFVGRGVSDAPPTTEGATHLSTSGAIARVVNNKADRDAEKFVSSPLRHNILYGLRSDSPASASYIGKAYFSTGDSKIHYIPKKDTHHKYSPQTGVAYFNVADKTWYAWNGTAMVALNTLTVP
jgi:hypothetical protein